jgi:hypothetical protein
MPVAAQRRADLVGQFARSHEQIMRLVGAMMKGFKAISMRLSPNSERR